MPSDLGKSVTVGVEDLDDQARGRAHLRGVQDGGIRSECQRHAVADDGAGDVNGLDGNAVGVHERVVLIEGHSHREPAGLRKEVAEAHINAWSTARELRGDEFVRIK